jgi:hypothetical protein
MYYSAPKRVWPPWNPEQNRRNAERLNAFLVKNIEAAQARGDTLKASQYADAMVFR